MNKRRFVSIISFALFFNEGAIAKNNAMEDNAHQGRTNDSIKPIGKKYRHNSFYDFEHWDYDEKLDMIKSIQAIHRTSSSIDWDEMRDRYIMQVLDDLDIDKDSRPSPSQPPPSSNEIIKSETRRRLSETDTRYHPRKRILGKKGKKTKKFKKKKYKSKGSKKKKYQPMPTPPATEGPTRGSSLVTVPPSASPHGGSSNSSKKSKGKSKKENKSNKSKKSKKGKVVIKKTKNGWCIVSSPSTGGSGSSYKSQKSKGKSKKYRYGDTAERGRALKKGKKKYFTGNTFYTGKMIKIKKKKKSKGKGSKKSNKLISPLPPPSAPLPPSAPAPTTTTTTMSPTSSIDYYYHGKGKSNKHHYKYPFCDDLQSVAPNTTTSPSISTSPSQSPSKSPSPSQNDNPRTRNPTRTPLTRSPTRTQQTQAPTLDPTPDPTPNPTPNPTRATPDPTPNPTSKPIKQTPAPTISPKPTPEQGIYRYDKGNCPASGSEGVPCAQETNIRKVCNRYDEEFGSFRECWNICRPAFCCIHDADPDLNYLSPSCSQDENCAQYAYCYIVWFKFHDTFGPATFINVEQRGNFFDVDNDEVRGNKIGDEFFDQLYFHHFNDVRSVIEEGTNPNDEFELDIIFEDPFYWDNNI